MQENFQLIDDPKILTKKNQDEFLLRMLCVYLNSRSAADLFALAETAVVKQSEWHLEMNERVKDFLEEASQTRIRQENSGPLPEADLHSIKEMEKACVSLKNLIKKNELSHLERLVLLWIYGPLGKKGIERLFEIMSRQKNFSEKMTQAQIESYKKKNLHRDIGCSKLKELGICKEKFCFAVR